MAQCMPGHALGALGRVLGMSGCASGVPVRVLGMPGCASGMPVRALGMPGHVSGTLMCVGHAGARIGRTGVLKYAK